MIHATFQSPEALDIERASVGTILQQLMLRGDRLSMVAARIIRSQEDALLTLDNEVVEAEWRVMALAVEIDRMKDHRSAFEARRNAKAARR